MHFIPFDSQQETLDRFLARRLKLSWAQSRIAIHHRRVAIDGVPCNRYHQHLNGSEVVSIDHQVVMDGIDDGVLLCNKPPGYASSHDPTDQPLLYDLIPATLAHPDMQAAGRLDRDTSGLIVLTIDGQLIQRLTSPRNHCRKRYQLRFRGILRDDAEQMVAAGLLLEDDPLPCLPAQLQVHLRHAEGGAATLILSEGRFHQVKRMVKTLGGEVTSLHRDRIGCLDLPGDLAHGSMRVASAEERQLLTKVP
jgi:16S rRNA pseudouridine516 synthase